MNALNELQPSEMKALIKKIIICFTFLPLLIGSLVLLPAGTFFFWQFYIYLTIIIGLMFFVVLYFLKKDPKFLERRMKMKEQQSEQKKIILIGIIPYVAGYIVPGLDHRFGWSDVPFFVVMIADLLVLLSYIFIINVFKVNSYASRVVEVDKKNQTVISTGPYSVIRHPMYLGVIIMFLSTPVALGSYWGIIPFAVLPVVLRFRILNEEKVLSEQLPGYTGYCQKVRHRLIPFVW